MQNLLIYAPIYFMMLKFSLPLFRLSTILLSFFLSCLCQAQKNAFTGYFVDIKGDTIKGTILDYKQLERSPQKILFRILSSNRQIILSPADTKYVDVENYDSYISYKGPRMTNTIDYQRVYEQGLINKENTFDSVKVFLRLIASTPDCDIYALSDRTRLNFFYKTKDGTITELLYKIQFINGTVIASDQYKQQLQNIFEKQIEDKHLKNALTNLAYSESSIRSFINLLQPQIEKTPDQRIKEKRFIVFGGVSLNSFKVEGDETFDAAVPGYNRYVSPLIGIGYMATIRRNLGKFFIYPQIKAYNFKHEGSFSNATFTATNVFQTSIIINPLLSVGMNVKNEKKFKWYAAGGLSALFLSDNKYTNTRVYNSASTVTTVYTNESFAINANVQTGVILNEFILFGTYIVPARVMDRPSYVGKHSGFQFGVV